MSDKTGLYGLPLPESEQKPPKKRRWWIRIPVIIAVVVWISLYVLSLIGGPSMMPSLKEGLEDYFRESTGMMAHIGKLNEARFYPEHIIDIENINFYDTEMSEGSAAVTIESAALATGFWSNMMGQMTWRALDLRNARISEGVLLPRELYIERAGIQADNAEKPFFIVKGTYDGKPVDISLVLTSRTIRSGKTEYRVADRAPFDLKIGPVSGKGFLDMGGGKGVIAEFETLQIQDALPLKGRAAFMQELLSKKISADFSFGGSKVNADLKLTVKNGMQLLSGNIVFETLEANQMLGKGGVTDVIKFARFFVLGQELAKGKDKRPYDLRLMDVDVQVTAKSLKIGGMQMGHLELPVKELESLIVIGPFSGAVKGGMPDGTVEIDARTIPAKMKADIRVQGLNYESLATEDGGEGRADIRIEAASEGNNTAALWQSMKGKAMIVAGQGDLAVIMKNLWGGKLLNEMMPFANGGEFALNCGVADFKINGGITSTETFLLDGSRATIVGEGSLNFDKGTMRMMLDPEAKEPEFLSEAFSVSIVGPIKNPSVTKDKFSLMTRMGSLFLGTIDPGTLAFSLNEMGLAEQHPCYGYMKK